MNPETNTLETPTCTVGMCERPATRRLEIRRTASDDHPAEVRRVCASKLCLKLALSSAHGFFATVQKGA